MAILRKKTCLNDHLQSFNVRCRPKRFMIYHDFIRNERHVLLRTWCIIQKSNPAAGDNLLICTITTINSNFQSNECNHRKETN